MKQILLIFLCLITLIGCKKKPISDWVKYQKSVEKAIGVLNSLKEQELETTANNFDRYKIKFQEVEKEIDSFLKETESQKERQSRLSIEYAMEDFRLVYELLAKPSSSANQFSYGKIFADSDAELFDKVKKRYKLGPELVLAKQQYYFVDSILHEAWKSASNNIARAQKRLAEEAVEEAKKRKKASRSSDGSKTPQKTVE